MIRACAIFDLDGTLCDTNGVDDECYRLAAAAALDIPVSEVDWTGAPDLTDFRHRTLALETLPCSGPFR